MVAATKTTVGAEPRVGKRELIWGGDEVTVPLSSSIVATRVLPRRVQNRDGDGTLIQLRVTRAESERGIKKPSHSPFYPTIALRGQFSTLKAILAHLSGPPMCPRTPTSTPLPLPLPRADVGACTCSM